jgi:hypothetical protein
MYTIDFVQVKLSQTLKCCQPATQQHRQQYQSMLWTRETIQRN